VAKEIAKQTGYKVFHNHLSIDCIEPIFDFGSESFFKLIELIRVETVAEAARSNVNLIYTFCYAKDSDDEHVRLVTEAVESNGGEIRFVLLVAEKSEIEKRVSAESRKRYGKAKNTAILHEIWNKYDLFSPVPERESLIINNTNLSAEETAEKIIDYYNLREKADEIRKRK
jgi:RNase adaptor protein for sRNA GlmZ degradation